MTETTSKKTIKWPEQGRRICLIQDDSGEGNINKAAKQYGLSYSTYYYARSGQRIGVEFLASVYQTQNVSANYIMAGVGNIYAPTDKPDVESILFKSKGLSPQEKSDVAIALLAGWDKYKLEIDEKEECNWPNQGRKFRMLLDRLGYKKISPFTEDYGLNYSTLHYAYHGIRFGTELLMLLHEEIGLSFDYLINDVGTMFLDSPKLEYDLIDLGLQLESSDRKELAVKLIG